MTTSARLFGPCMILAAGCTGMMWLVPGQETIPYHLAWIAVALCYGIEPWPWGRAVLAVVALTTATGLVLFVRAATGVIAWGELAEIPLMSTLVLLVVWNVRRRYLAFDALSRIARRDRTQAARRERLGRMTSHEMRTPATMAIGYVEILLANEPDPDRRGDLTAVREELGRLVMAGDRMMRSIRINDHEDFHAEELSALLAETRNRWAALADRDWQVRSPRIMHVCSAERMRACLDTLVENALRYTEDGDTVRLVADTVGTSVLVGVADSGPGMHPTMLEAIGRGESEEDYEAYTACDPKAQTGLGLALVSDAAAALGGRLVAGRSAEGGALVAMAVPRRRLRSWEGAPRPHTERPVGQLA